MSALGRAPLLRSPWLNWLALGRWSRKLVAVRGCRVCDVTGDDYENLIRTRCRVPRDARQRCEPPPASRRKSTGNPLWRAFGSPCVDLEPSEALDHAGERTLLFHDPEFAGRRSDAGRDLEGRAAAPVQERDRAHRFSARRRQSENPY